MRLFVGFVMQGHIWSAVCMTYNSIALFHVDFVMNTNREILYFIYTQNCPRIQVNNVQNKISSSSFRVNILTLVLILMLHVGQTP